MKSEKKRGKNGKKEDRIVRERDKEREEIGRDRGNRENEREEEGERERDRERERLIERKRGGGVDRHVETEKTEIEG